MDYSLIIENAWQAFDGSKAIKNIEDISARVSTNYVFRITFDDDDIIIAKLSHYGMYEHFVEDHRIIHTLSNNLLYPFENVLAKSLLKNNRVYTYRYNHKGRDTWVVFYNPSRVMNRFPRRLSEDQIKMFGQQVARFHKACGKVANVLPKSSKTLRTDVMTLIQHIEANEKQFGNRMQTDYVKYHCELFLRNRLKHNAGAFQIMPVFIDWNIGNFSVTEDLELFSRWDYDWFRMSSRMMDFYFLSRVVSDAGDRTVFSYGINTLTEPRFISFLQEYHKINPLTADEINFLREAYRFFILNYVLKDGSYFFSRQYAMKLQQEALEIYLPSVDKDFDPELLIQAIGLHEKVLA